MLSASDISCMGDLDAAGDTGIERTDDEARLGLEPAIVVGSAPGQRPQPAFWMKVPLGRRDDLEFDDAAVVDTRPVQQQPARSFGQSDAFPGAQRVLSHC